MTVREWADYFADREFFSDPDQEVQLVLDSGVRVELKGTTVHMDGGAAVMELKASPVRKYMFSLKFAANPVIEAHTVEEAEARAYELMRHRAVVDTCTGDGDEDFAARKPYFLEEVKE